MKHSVSILGCGWLGLAVAKELMAKGYQVKASSTSSTKLSHFKKEGLHPFLIDIGQLNESIADFLTTDILLVAITSKRLIDYQNLIKALKTSNVGYVLYVSSTSVYPMNNQVVTEASETLESPLVAIEQLFQKQNSFKTTIVRFGGLYGYDRNPANFVSGKLLKDPEGFINFIHRDDAVEILVQLLKNKLWGETFNACMDSHPKRSDFYIAQSNKMGVEPPKIDASVPSNYKIVDSQKLISALQYTFKHNS